MPRPAAYLVPDSSHFNFKGKIERNRVIWGKKDHQNRHIRREMSPLLDGTSNGKSSVRATTGRAIVLRLVICVLGTAHILTSKVIAAGQAEHLCLMSIAHAWRAPRTLSPCRDSPPDGSNGFVFNVRVRSKCNLEIDDYPRPSVISRQCG